METQPQSPLQRPVADTASGTRPARHGRLTPRRRPATRLLTIGIATTAVVAVLIPVLTAAPAGATNAPTVTSVVADSGPSVGGQTVTILGTNLSLPTSVRFGASDAPVVASTATSVTATDPVGTGGTVVDVTVTTSGGASATSSGDRYTYIAPPTDYVVDKGDASVLPVITASGATGKPIPVGASPARVAITPSGSTAFVADTGSGTVTPIATASGVAGHPIAVGSGPNDIAIAPDGTTAYVTDTGSGTVTPITVATDTAGPPITVGVGPVGVALTPDGRTAFVADSGSDAVTPINLSTATAGPPIPVGSSPDDVAIAPDGTTAYVTDTGSGTVTPITVATDTAGPPIAVGVGPVGLAVTPDGRTAFVADSGSDAVTPINLSTATAGPPIPVGSSPDDVAIAPDGMTAYVTDLGSNSVTPVSTATDTAGPDTAVGNSPVGIAVAPDQAPTASFTVSPASPGSATTFDGSASGTPQGRLTNYAWAFGDGTSSARNASAISTHTYAGPGPFTATLTVTDTAGTSTAETFTGQTVSDNGSSSAMASRTVAPPPAVTPVTPATPAASPVGSPRDVSPPASSVTPPVSAGRAVVAPPNTLSFAGYQWTVKSSTSPVGPGPNLFDASGPSVDSSGAMHLRIVKTSSGWESSEVVLDRTLGYGTYSWTLGGPVTTLDPDVVLGLLTYDNSDTSPTNREIDFEDSRWANPSDPTNAQYVVQPSYLMGNLQRITIPKGETTVRLTWVPGSVSFSGDTVRANGKTVALPSWKNSSPSVPTSSTEQIHMNLWLFQGRAPLDGKAVTVKVSGFAFTPAP